MLALVVEKEGSLFIGDDVRITVAAISRKRVKLLIEAPERVRVHRQRLLERMLGLEGFRRFVRALEERCRRKKCPGRRGQVA